MPDHGVTYKCSAGTACVEGSSTGSKTWGVYGVASHYGGLYGVTNATNGSAGVSGVSTNSSGTGRGLFGHSANGQGVFGTSSSSNGVEGHTTSIEDFAGVAGYGTDVANGVYGNGLAGVLGESSKGGDSIYAISDDATTDIFYGVDSATHDTCSISAKANLKCSGKITGAAVRVQHRNSAGQQVLTYASESSTATIEDFGTARMFGGIANVALEPAFASVIDRGSPYYVFLTPLGDTRGLFVSIKTAAGFQVRETEHGRSSLSFDYRVVARPFDAPNDRLPLAPAIRRPLGRPAR
jgi:hypothetical protein